MPVDEDRAATQEEVALLRHTCDKCGHVWLPRVNTPVRCPKCQSVKWDEPVVV